MELIIRLVVLVFSIILHEVAHGYAAYRLGDPTAKDAKRLTLNPLAHVDPMGSIVLPLILVLTNSPVLFGFLIIFGLLWIGALDKVLWPLADGLLRRLLPS